MEEAPARLLLVLFKDTPESISFRMASALGHHDVEPHNPRTIPTKTMLNIACAIQRQQDDNENKIALLRGGHGGQTGKLSKTLFSHGKRHDNKISKVQILLSRNFVVIAQAPSNGLRWAKSRDPNRESLGI